MFFLWFRWKQTSHSFVYVFIINTILGTLAWKFQGVPTTLRNYKRVIEVWFDDEYKEFFYTREPLARLIDHGDISEQLAMKERMKCKSFDWFMNEIAYDVFDKYPKLPPNKFWGELKNEGSKTCIDTMGRHPPSAIGVSGCHGGGGYQLMLLNTEVGVDIIFIQSLSLLLIVTRASCPMENGASRQRALTESKSPGVRWEWSRAPGSTTVNPIRSTTVSTTNA